MHTLKSILLILVNILLIPLGMITSAGTVWFTLPGVTSTELGIWLVNTFSTTGLFWMTIISAILFVILSILHIIFSKRQPAKLKNFFTHLNTWAIALVAIFLAIYTFIYCNPLVAETVVISIPRKISIGITLLFLIAFHIFSGKISTLLNRKIQAYDTAKEMNTVGRSSVIVINFLKLFEVFFPEMLVLLLICYCVSWNVASFFIVVLVASLIPMIGNIVCDFTTRKEIKLNQEKEKDDLAKRVADNMKR